MTSPFNDVCRHVHAARIAAEVHNTHDEKQKLVSHFRDKEWLIPPDLWEMWIQHFKEIVRLFTKDGYNIFSAQRCSFFSNRDPFRPASLPHQGPTTGCTKVLELNPVIS